MMAVHLHNKRILFLITHTLYIRLFSSASLPKPPSLPHLPSSKEEVTLAREWLRNFSQCSIPRDEVEMTFARSSGPGGQVRIIPVSFLLHIFSADNL